jgi:hypothetical protein
MSTAPIPPVVRSPLVRDVTDASQNRSKQFIPSAYAVGKLFTGVTLKDDIDLDTYVAPGVSRVNTYKNGPPVTSPGYLVIHTVNPDEDKSTFKYRYRQIYYPDSTTETTPYTRVGNSTNGTTITWSVWTTMGGNWVCEILGGNKTGIVNYMYHSFNSWTLTLPDPKLYVTGTRIGLTQWVNNGKVVWGTNEQVTTPDISEEGTVVGALQYIFQIVPKKQPDGSSVNIWALDVDNNIDGTVEKLVENFQSKVDTINTTITNLTNRVAKEEQTRASEDTAIRNEFRAADTALENDLNAKIEKKQRLMKHFINVTNATVTNGSGNYDISEFDYTLEVIANGTISIYPSSSGNAGPHGARLVLHLHPGITTVVKYIKGEPEYAEETFQNTSTSDILVIDMQLTYVNNTTTWTVLEVG